MLKRTLFFGNPLQLKTKNEQLLITNKETGLNKQVPIEDIGFVVIEHPEIYISIPKREEAKQKPEKLIEVK